MWSDRHIFVCEFCRQGNVLSLVTRLAREGALDNLEYVPDRYALFLPLIYFHDWLLITTCIFPSNVVYIDRHV